MSKRMKVLVAAMVTVLVLSAIAGVALAKTPANTDIGGQHNEAVCGQNEAGHNEAVCGQNEAGHNEAVCGQNEAGHNEAVCGQNEAGHNEAACGCGGSCGAH